MHSKLLIILKLTMTSKKILNSEPKILIFEDLSINPKYFINSLVDFLGIKNQNIFKNIDFSS